MPAERTRSAIHKVPQLTWTVPVEPSTPQNIAFAPNLTPITFNDPPPAPDASESILFPPALADCPSTRRPGHNKKKPENHIPRPPNAFILFRSSFIKSQHVSTDVETNHSTLSKIIGLTWQNLPPEERSVWHAKAKAALDDHRRKFPQYAFRPLHPKKGGTTSKRKVREVGPKDMKRCEKIAELLVEGKKGLELDAAIQEFDRHHVPEVVTRFEAPITARMYRRSSSAPVPDPAAARKPFLSPATPSRPRRVRASSSQPTRYSSPCPSEPPSVSSQTSTDSETSSFFSPPFSPPFPSTPVYTFPPKCEPSFEFAPFTFEDSVPSPISDPLMQDSPFGLYAQQQQERSQYNPSPLSINTSFMEDWTPASSPFSSSPATPQSAALDSPCEYQPDTMDAFRLDWGAPAPAYDLPTMDTYPAKAFDGPFDVPVDFGALAGDSNGCFMPSSSKAEYAHLDLDFTALMSSIPQYTL